MPQTIRIVLATVTVATLAAGVAASASPSITSHSSARAFSGKPCGLIPTSVLASARITAPCLQKTTRTSVLGTAYTANYGKQTPQSADGTNHFLGISVIKLAPNAVAIWQAEQGRTLKSGDVLFHNAKSWADFHTQTDDTTTKKGVAVKGANGVLLEFVGSYGVQVNLFARPSTEQHVGTLLTLIAIHLRKALK